MKKYVHQTYVIPLPPLGKKNRGGALAAYSKKESAKLAREYKRAFFK